MALGGPDDAARHYELALELLPHVGDTATTVDQVDVVGLVLRASEATVAAGHPFRGLALVQDQLRQLPEDGTPEQRVRLLQALANVALLVDTGIDVLQVTTEAMNLLPDQTANPLRARLRQCARPRPTRTGIATTKRPDGPSRPSIWRTSWTCPTWPRMRRPLWPCCSNERVTPIPRDATWSEPSPRPGRPARWAPSFAACSISAPYITSKAACRRPWPTYRTAVQRATDQGRPWAPYGLDARMMTGIVAYVSGDWDDVLRVTDVSGESPPALAEAVLAAVALAVAAGRGDHRALDLLPRLRSWWERDGLRSWSERDGLIAILSGAAAIDLYGDRGELDAASAVHDDVVACVGEMWQLPDFQARIRLNGLLLGQLCAEAVRGGISERATLVRPGGRAGRERHRGWQRQPING